MTGLDNEDIRLISHVSKTFLIYVRTYRSKFWKNNATTFFGEHLDPKQDARALCWNKRKLYIPAISSRYGSNTTFVFKDPVFFKAHYDRCLRVVAMYAII